MEKIILTTILLLFFFQNGISQTEPREIKYFHYKSNWQGDDFRKTYETEKSYDANDNLSTLIIKVYNEDETIKYWLSRFYEYDTNIFLKKYTASRYNQDVDLWITNFWVDYQYNQNGCLVEEQTTQNIGGQISRRLTYTRNSDCQITSQLEEWLANGFDLSLKDYFTRFYHSDGISYDEKLYSHSSIGGSLYLKIDRKIIFGQNKKTSKTYWTIFNSSEDTLYHVQNFYTYDEYDNIILNSEYRNQSINGWQLHRQTFYENEYDENGFLTKKNTEVWGYDITNLPDGILNYTKENIYQNSCEGIVEEYTRKEGESKNLDVYEYVYEGINECLDIENLDLDVTISPNPSDGKVEIYSSIFKTGNTDISLFGIDGKVLLQKKEISRCESSSIDLTSLSNGIYIFHLQNGDHFVNEKIVIAK